MIGRRQVLLGGAAAVGLGAAGLAGLDREGWAGPGSVAGAPPRPPSAGPLQRPIRGMTVSTPTWGGEWGTDAMDATLDHLLGLGVTWVSFHPYASIAADGTVSARSLDPAAPPTWLRRPILAAHARGMRVLVIPHVAYWGSPFAWRGDITFADEASWQRFFASHGRWMLEVARCTADADAFCVGNELDATVHRPEWRPYLDAVRAATPVPLTYAANWDRHAQVPFWDALDAVGVQAYFPLAAPGAVPTREVLHHAWSRVIDRLSTTAPSKPLLFTELGYTCHPDAAAEPWEARVDEAGAEVQRLCMEVALDTVERNERVLGAFLWKWFPGQRQPRDFRMADPAVQAVLRGAWG